MIQLTYTTNTNIKKHRKINIESGYLRKDLKLFKASPLHEGCIRLLMLIQNHRNIQIKQLLICNCEISFLSFPFFI